ncbi:MAG: hypothetical protein ACLQUY_17135 [Ktedonobacterales bacterium]
MEAFETYRPYLFSIAYRMLGSAMDAEYSTALKEAGNQAAGTRTA